MTEDVSAGQLLLDTLRASGVRYAFANFGSDHPSIIEALAADRDRGITEPAVILCPHETTALSAAHGYSVATGEPTAVFVHTDVGTANLGGAVHNAARSRAPVFIFAGLTPFTLEGELPGTRNTHINHLQDVPDQHALVRQYVKWSYDLRTARNIPQVVRRGMQLALSAPAGPVYLTAAREVLAERVPWPSVPTDEHWPAISLSPAPEETVADLLTAIDRATRAVVVTSYVGRNPAAVGHLVAAAEYLGLSVVEVNAEHVGFPADHHLHAGDDAHSLLDEADVLIALDTDAPWLPSVRSPRPDATVAIVNENPLQESIPLWYLPARHVIRADAGRFLQQLLTAAQGVSIDPAQRSARIADAEQLHVATRAQWANELSADRASGRITAATVASTVDEIIDEDAVVLNEAITEAPTVWRHLTRIRPASLFGNRGTSLGWSGGGALGVKLAMAGRPVVSIIGDGTFFLSVPSSSYWVADRYGIPVLTVVLDNGGWGATKRNLLRQYPDHTAQSTDRYWVNLQQSADFPGIAAAAGGAWGSTVDSLSELQTALSEALSQIARGRAAIVVVKLDPISDQHEDRLAG